MTDDPLIGRQLANFRIERVLGRGGMAQVYYGQDVKLKRPVAIKVIDVRFRGNPSYAQRFVREAQAVATWRHENITQVYYADEEGELYYFVMEYIDGMELGGLMAAYTAKGELMPHTDVIRIGRALASALDYAHQKGVIHRDVKPANALIARDGRVVLSDFGLALDVQQGSMGDVFGTAHYIAPEQARRSSEAIPQSDLYSLGVILYEMLTGVVPFDDPSPTAVAIQHITQPPPPPREINPDLSAEVEAVLLKALSKAPTSRYASGHEVMDALEKALQAGTVAAPPLALPLMPAGMTPPPARLSSTTVAEIMALQPKPPSIATPPLPAATAPPKAASQPIQPTPIIPKTSARPAPQKPATANNPILLFAVGGGVLVLLALIVLGGFLFLRPPATEVGSVTATNTKAPQATADLTKATSASPTESSQPTTSLEATATSELTPLPASETATAEPATSAAVPTVKYPSGKRFMLYYDNNSFYLLNLSADVVSIYSVAFERLSTSDVPLNRFDGWRWAEFYPNSKPEWCMALEILSSKPYLKPPECTKGYLSTRTPTRDDAIVFWTPQDGSQQFRVLWKQNNQDEEVARCELSAHSCEVFFP